METKKRPFGTQVDFAIKTVKELFPGKLAKKTKEARLKQNLSQDDLAKKADAKLLNAGITASLIDSIEKGWERKLPKETIDVLGEILNIDLTIGD